MATTGAAGIRCAVCGERIGRGRAGGYSHRARLVAACEIDADHRAVPDWTAYGEIPCRVCGAPTVASGEGFTHLDAARDPHHTADPDLPAG